MLRTLSILLLSCLALVVTGPAAATPPPPPTCDEAPYDIDGNSEIEPLADGVLLLRYFFGFRGDVLISGALGDGCTRCTAPTIEAFIEAGLAGCPDCGNNIAEAGEECDGPDHGGDTCVTIGFWSGDLGCTASCTFDLTACTNCGNGVVNFEDGEVCDGANMGGTSCQSLGFLNGNLFCDGGCVYDASDCSND